MRVSVERRHAPLRRGGRALPVLLSILVAGAALPPVEARAQQRDSVARAAAANDSARARGIRDSVAQPPISPRSAFLSSVLLPGYGQARLERGQAGALFVLVEAISLAMIQKSAADLRQARRFENDSLVFGYTTTSGNPTIPNPTDPNGGTVTVRCREGFTPGYRDTGTSTVPIGGGAPQRLYAIVCPTYFSTRLVQARRTHVEDWVALLLFNHLIAGADAYVAAHLWDLPGRVAVVPAPGGGTALSLQVRW